MFDPLNGTLKASRTCFPVVLLSVLLIPGICAAEQAKFDAVDRAIKGVLVEVAAAASDLDAKRSQRLKAASEQLMQSAGSAVFPDDEPTADRQIALTVKLLTTKRRVDDALDRTLSLRTQFADMPAGEARRETIRQFLATTTTLIDLSGKLRYLLRDAISSAAYYAAASSTDRLRLIELLIEHRSGIGAGVMADLLKDPEPELRISPASDFVKGKVLQLIAASHESDLLSHVAKVVTNPDTSDPLTILAAECIRRLGLPQKPHPEQDAKLPQPVITADVLHARLHGMDGTSLSARLQERHKALVD